jgi:hypothetical protein
MYWSSLAIALYNELALSSSRMTMEAGNLGDVSGMVVIHFLPRLAPETAPRLPAPAKMIQQLSMRARLTCT